MTPAERDRRDAREFTATYKRMLDRRIAASRAETHRLEALRLELPR